MQFLKYLSFLAVILLTSCAKDVIYSCNPTIQKEVKQNLPKYSGMSREEWKQLPDSLKMAAYAAMKPEIKRAFWEEKRIELMQLDWLEDQDREHIALLFSIFEKFPDFFEDKFMENSFNKEYVDNFTAEWNNYAEKELDWAFVLRYAVSASGEEVDVPFLGETIIKTNSPPTNLEHAGGGGFGIDCDCSRSSDWCGSKMFCGQFDACNKKPYCGTLWSKTCDGLCFSKDWDYNGNGNNGSAIMVGEKYPILRGIYIVFDKEMRPYLIK